ncbi:MAG TPA: gamma-glutamyltransferase family protein [Anaerolineae bacterium]|nr:gamma-glutamyltransferase family protein [Anaerolineae bacterium]HQH39802.1 gamma-glutamyltransferase family protein [Anaerolineae bacterium]
MQPFTWDLPYPSRRMPILAQNVVATSQPLAAQAGLDALRRGGNAVDAALATAIALTVVEPTSNGLGSDAFAIVWDGAGLHGLNASGRAPQALTPERFAGLKQMPTIGWDPVTVPGAVSAWAALAERFGKLPFAELFTAAIHYARDGFLVSPITARAWAGVLQRYADYPAFAATFAPDGRAPHPGELFRCPDQARTLETIAATQGEAFYRGALAERIVAHAQATGGLMTVDDLASHAPEWVTPLAQIYRGYCLHEIPPNGQGLAALIALGILQHFDLAQYPVDSADSIHLQVEAMKLAFAEAHRHIADPAWMDIPPQALLDETFLAERARQIRMDAAQFPAAALPTDHGTVYLAAADAEGMMVSYIQSNYMGFGSGIVVPGTGISLQNRGAGFRLEAGHPNRVAGGKRPYHTIIPGFVTQAGKPVMSCGVMGGAMQPQGHVQMMVRLFDYGQNPQAASDAPRWYIEENPTELSLEPGFAPEVVAELRRRGHHVTADLPPGRFGGAQLIYRLESGYCAGTDWRKDGQATGY